MDIYWLLDTVIQRMGLSQNVHANAWFMYALVTNLRGSDLHLNSMFLQSIIPTWFWLNQPVYYKYIWTEPPGGSQSTGSERGQKRGPNEARK